MCNHFHGICIFIIIMCIQAPRRRSVLPSHLHSVMGSANLTLARGDTSGAIELCMEVIRQGTEPCNDIDSRYSYTEHYIQLPILPILY